MEKIENNSWLFKTNQIWKYRLFLAIMYFGIFLIILKFSVVNNLSKYIITLTYLIGFIWFLFAIKCPICKRKPMLKIIKKANLSRLTQTITSFEKCPFCGNGVDSNRPSIRD
jgi:hypothetical protein